MRVCSGGEGREDLWQGSTPRRSSLELPLRCASSDVLAVSEARAILTPVNLCSDSSDVHRYINQIVIVKVCEKNCAVALQ